MRIRWGNDMIWEIFGNETKLGMELGSINSLNNKDLWSKFPISQISQKFSNIPNFGFSNEATYTSYSRYIRYLEIEKSQNGCVSIFILSSLFFRWEIWEIGKSTLKALITIGLDVP
jgi:hypothetical protein